MLKFVRWRRGKILLYNRNIYLIMRLRPSGRGSRRAFIDMNQNRYRKLTELAFFLSKNAELIEQVIYLLFVMLN